MMRGLFAACAVVALAGCAISPDTARQLSSFELCEKIASPMTPASSVGVALNELTGRDENCSQFADIYAARQSASRANGAAMLATGLTLMEQSRPIYVPAAAPTTIVIEQAPPPVRFTRPYP